MNEWIEWQGGACPIDGDVMVEAIFESGKKEIEYASFWHWGRFALGEGDNIIKYRVIEPKSELDILKEKYATGEYIAVANIGQKSMPRWVKIYPELYGFNDYKLIHKRHEDVLNAYLAENSVKIEKSVDGSFFDSDFDFIGDYNENNEYRLKADVGDISVEIEPKPKEKPIQYQIGIDTFDRAKANMTPDEILAVCKFMIDKYAWRVKGQDKDDFKKIKDYADLALWAINEKEQQCITK